MTRLYVLRTTRSLFGVAVSALLFCISSCSAARVFYGHTEAEWMAMTPEQQVSAKAEFEQVVKSREEQKRREQMAADMQRTIEIGQRGGK